MATRTCRNCVRSQGNATGGLDCLWYRVPLLGRASKSPEENKEFDKRLEKRAYFCNEFSMEGEKK